MTQLDLAVIRYVPDYNKLSPKDKTLKKIRLIGEKRLINLISDNFELKFLENEYTNGNTEFDNDTPYPFHYWCKIAGFEQSGMTTVEIPSPLREIINSKDYTTYTFQEGIDILKHAATLAITKHPK